MMMLCYPLKVLSQYDVLLHELRLERTIRFSSHKAQTKADVVLSAQNVLRAGKRRYIIITERYSKVR